ncbi:uncharacterized protein [Triticum aestivum]|uniref:uncharacterized protein isoform X2 n=1 Tax=Triticum aestivum TaxID=4565 RepID=UPI001D018A52|nr:uncharacterized protein LOC123052715 isoform X2 [Triticum aestivum]
MPFTAAAPRPTVSSHLPPAPWAPVCVPYPSRKIWWPSASNLSLTGILCCVLTVTISIGASTPNGSLLPAAVGTPGRWVKKRSMIGCSYSVYLD